MKKTLKIFLSLCCALLLAVAPAVNTTVAMANVEAERVESRSIQEAICTLNISGLTATCKFAVSAVGASSVCSTMELQKLKSGSWETVKSETYTGIAVTSGEFTKLITPGTFRVKLTTTAVKNGVSETIVAYSDPQ